MRPAWFIAVRESLLEFYATCYDIGGDTSHGVGTIINLGKINTIMCSYLYIIIESKTDAYNQEERCDNDGERSENNERIKSANLRKQVLVSFCMFFSLVL